MRAKRIIISGGGTAGHLYPGLAVGQKLREKEPDLQVTLVGTGRDIEKKIVERYPVGYLPLRIEGLKGKGFKILKSLLLLPSALVKSFVILRKMKPHLVLGVGGYSSGPVVLLAALLGIPTLILEQNIRPGLANRLLIPWVKKAVVSFESSLPYFRGKGIFIGNPVREEFYNLPPKTREDRLSLLIFGGSQGSLFLNRAMTSSLPQLRQVKERLMIFHQTGQMDYDWVKNSYAENGFHQARVEPFFFDMARCFEESDLIICRAGASTIAELVAARKASLLVPFAKATDDHQLLNARELEKIETAEIMLEEEFIPERFASKILGFIQNKEKITKMEKNLAKLKTVSAAEEISRLCLELMKKP